VEPRGFSHFFLEEGDKYLELMEEREKRAEAEAAAFDAILWRHREAPGSLLDRQDQGGPRSFSTIRCQLGERQLTP
jgi:hypothetical protein